MQRELQSLSRMIARFAPTNIAADLSQLSDNDRAALAEVIKAAQCMDEIYLRQVWEGNVAMRDQLQSGSSELMFQRHRYFAINKGPWSRLDHNKPFVAGAPEEKPTHAAYYPADMSKDEFTAWLAGLDAGEREKAIGFFHTIRRNGSGALHTVPYSVEYAEFLKPAAEHLRRAAELTDNESLKRFLNARADAFLSDDYFASDCDWMDLDAPIDVTIGPYETYEDETFGYKAAFEAFVTVLNVEETRNLAQYSHCLQEVEDHLPMHPGWRNKKLGADSPIRVVDVVFTSGEANHGIQTAAFNLPNDERVVREKGSKRVMLKNVQHAKFDQVLTPIAARLLDPRCAGKISFEAFFTHILWHELLHGLGPHNIKVRGRATTVRHELKDLYSAIEEAKADIAGLWALQYLIDRGVFGKELELPMYVTFLAGAFRSIRFGIGEAHGRGQALQFNFLCDEGAIKFGKNGYRVDVPRMKEAVEKLTRIILTIEAKGDYDGAKALLKRYARIRPRLARALARVEDVPVDINPIFSAATELLGE